MQMMIRPYYDLSKIDLGKDEAEQDQRLREYFLRTSNYENAFAGKKTIVIGRKGSGKSAIFTLMRSEIEEGGSLVIPITPDQYSWSALKQYKEQGILPVHAHTNAWKLTILSSVIWALNEKGLILSNSKLSKYYQFMQDAYIPPQNWLLNVINKINIFPLKIGYKDFIIQLGLSEKGLSITPLRIIEEISQILVREWPDNTQVRIILDRLDDSWDASEESKHILIGLLKGANDINAFFGGKIVVTVFIRSDIYDNLIFDDKDKLRQNEEILLWNSEELKAVVCARVKVSLKLKESYEKIWESLFSNETYRSKASAEKYIVDRTFKRPRDILSFVRFAIETAINKGHGVIEKSDTRIAEEDKYGKSKYDDLIIEHNKQYPYIRDLLDSFSGSSHRLSQNELLQNLQIFLEKNEIKTQPVQLLRLLFVWGIIGIRRIGRAGVRQRGGSRLFYYYDDPSINPLAYNDYYIHPSLRYHLNIKERR